MRFTKPVRFRHDDALTRVSRSEFERLVATYYRERGYIVEHAGPDLAGRSDDVGVGSNLTLTRGDEITVVQCKHWVAQQVPHHDVHQLMGVMHAAGATRAIVVTSGEFTRPAIEAASRFPHVALIDGVGIRAMLGKVSEPPLPVLSANDTAPWADVDDRTPGRAPVFAAVGAVIVMALMLCVMYGVYIHEIQRAQMQAMQQSASQTHAGTAERVAQTPAPVVPDVP